MPNQRVGTALIIMVKIIKGERAGKDGKLAVGCSAAVFDESHDRISLIRRVDNGRWAVPGGYMDAGEDFAEACAREVYEETGLHVAVKRLLAIYTDPHLLLEYPDGNRWQLVVLHFETTMLGGELRPSNESSAINFYSEGDTKSLDMGMLDRLRIADSFANQESTIVRNEIGL
jgi:ADP-ribose pyrophosphatase YjhB (NUDIX family)